jgi:hypothetical protein
VAPSALQRSAAQGLSGCMASQPRRWYSVNASADSAGTLLAELLPGRCYATNRAALGKIVDTFQNDDSDTSSLRFGGSVSDIGRHGRR